MAITSSFPFKLNESRAPSLLRHYPLSYVRLAPSTSRLPNSISVTLHRVIAVITRTGP